MIDLPIFLFLAGSTITGPVLEKASQTQARTFSRVLEKASQTQARTFSRAFWFPARVLRKASQTQGGRKPAVLEKASQTQGAERIARIGTEVGHPWPSACRRTYNEMRPYFGKSARPRVIKGFTKIS